MEVTVTLDFDGTLTSTYPDYGDGWTVTARPGRHPAHRFRGHGPGVTTACSGRGLSEAEYDFSCGFCVAGGGHCGLPGGRPYRLGLTEREADEFIHSNGPPKSWKATPTICSSFQTDAYTNSAALTIDPAPDTRSGVPGVEGPRTAPVEVGGAQKRTDRAGARWASTAVEWGRRGR